MNSEEVYIAEAFKNKGIELTEEQVKQFYNYYSTLVEWNEKMNLTAITDFKDVVDKHFVDSCAPLFKDGPGIKENATLVDVGTGAGFPGLPLKIVRPDLKVTLIDSLNKRITFLNELIFNILKLTDINVYHLRAEEAGRNENYREKFDYVVSRAVANLQTLSEYDIPFLKTGGIFIAYKMISETDNELTAAKAFSILNSKLSLKFKYKIEGSNDLRILYYISKKGNISNKYPRAGGKPSSKPL